MNQSIFKWWVGHQSILSAHLPPMNPFYPEGRGLLQDHSGLVLHRARVVTEWLHEYEHDVSHLPWLSQSSDLNPVEQHIWRESGEALYTVCFANRSATVIKMPTNGPFLWKNGVASLQAEFHMRVESVGAFNLLRWLRVANALL